MNKIIFILLLFLIPFKLLSQHKWESPSLFIGTTYLKNFKTNSIYDPTLIIMHIPYSVLSKKHLKLHLGLEPQFNIVSIVGTYKKEFEYGINVLFRISYILNNTTIYAQPSIGPHYITHGTDIQIKGFIFSDNIGVGVTRQFKKLKIDLQTRYRHLSNAGLNEPNIGIDNMFILIGIGYWF